MNSPRPFIVGNWKMNGLGASLPEAVWIGEAARTAGSQVRVALCPPATLMERMSRALVGLPVEVGGQDCSMKQSGAYTGEVSAQMLRDAGAALVIVGHSERRTYHGETSEIVADKALAAAAAGLEPIICVGETLTEHDAGQALEVVAKQITASVPSALSGKALTLAYEPVWAVGAGVIPTTTHIGEVHQMARATLTEILGAAGEGVPILYGGSVKPGNIREILNTPQVGGVLVGGASLRAVDFTAIIAAA